MIAALVGWIGWLVVCTIGGCILAFLLQMRERTPMRDFMRWWGMFTGIAFGASILLVNVVKFYLWVNELFGRDPWQI